MPKGKNLECRFITQVNNLDGQPVETKFYWGRHPTSLVLKHIKTFSSVGPWMWKKLIFLNIILQILDRLSSSSRKLSAFFQLKLCQQALDTIPAHRNHPGSVCPAPPRPNLCVCVHFKPAAARGHLWNNKLLHPRRLWHWWSIASSRIHREAVHHHHLSTSKTQLWDDKTRGTCINKAQEKQMTGKQLTGNLKDKVSNLISLFLALSRQKRSPLPQPADNPDFMSKSTLWW